MRNTKKNKKTKRNDQEGGSSASTERPKKAKTDFPRESSRRKRSKSPDPEVLREKSELSKKEVLAIHNHDVAVDKLSKKELLVIHNHDVAVNKGSNRTQFKTENEWKMALGKQRAPYHDQMALRKIKWNANSTISQMINAILTYDKKENNYIII